MSAGNRTAGYNTSSVAWRREAFEISISKRTKVMDIHIGDKLKMKKAHPCGAFEWEVLRVGIDFRLKCTGCGHMIMIPRKQAEKNVKQIISPATANDAEKE